MKKVIFFCYGSICEPYIINALHRLGHVVIQIRTDCLDMEHQQVEMMQKLAQKVELERPDCVLSINFFPDVSNLCQKKGLRYVSYTVDVPVNTLFCEAIQNPWNRTFLFDRKQYETFQGKHQDGMWHLPLAAPLQDMQAVMQKADDKSNSYFSAEISFVGSLYTEKDEYVKFAPYLSDKTRGYLDGAMAAQMQIPGGLFVKELIDEQIAQEFIRLSDDMVSGGTDSDYVISHYLMGMHLAAKERLLYLNAIAEQFPLKLFTGSDPRAVPQAVFCGKANSYQEMPLIFANSKINLNITFRAIETGLPQRIWDVMGCGGFLMTTFSEEIMDYFSIGEEIECFTSKEELLDKIEYYLRQEDIRRQIALRGFEKVKKYHTYDIRLQQLLERAFMK